MRHGRFWALVLVVALLGAAYAQVSSGQRQLQAQRTEQFHNDVIAYAAFQSDISELGAAGITSEADVEIALERASRHNSEALARSWLLYGADIAAQSPAFVAGVREAAQRAGAPALTRSIAAQRSYARRLAGGDEAVRLVLSAFAGDSARVAAVAERFRQQAAALEAETWGASEATGQMERLERLRALGQPGGFAPSVSITLAARLAPAPLSVRSGAESFGGSRFWDAASGAPLALGAISLPAAALEEDRARTETLDAILSLAALRVLGASRPDLVNLYIRDPRSIGCMELARLQFHQCVSAAHFVYENAHCLARHGLRDRAQCIGALGVPAGSQAGLAAQAPTSVRVAAPPASPLPTRPAPQASPANIQRATAPSPAPATVQPPQEARIPQAPSVAAPAANAAAAQPAFAANLNSLGPGELFARADELDEQGAFAQARIVRRTLIARFPDSPLAVVAAQQLAGVATRSSDAKP